MATVEDQEMHPALKFTETSIHSVINRAIRYHSDPKIQWTPPQSLTEPINSYAMDKYMYTTSSSSTAAHESYETLSVEAYYPGKLRGMNYMKHYL